MGSGVGLAASGSGRAGSFKLDFSVSVHGRPVDPGLTREPGNGFYYYCYYYYYYLFS